MKTLRPISIRIIKVKAILWSLATTVASSAVKPQQIIRVVTIGLEMMIIILIVVRYDHNENCYCQ